MSGHKKLTQKNSRRGVNVYLKPKGSGLFINKTALTFSWVLFVFTFILYVNTISHDFTLDDDLIIGKNRLTQMGFKGIPELLTTAYRYGFSGSNHGLYRPLSPVMFAIEHQLFGLNPHANHFINILLYALTVVLLFRCLHLLLKHLLPERNDNFILPFVVSILFLAHPIHTEVVASIKSRDEILANLFIILSISYAVKSFRDNKPEVIKISISSFWFLLALLSKESAVTFLAIIPLVFYLFMHQSIKRSLMFTLPYVAVMFIYLAMFYFSVSTMVGTGGIGVINNSIVASDNVLDRFATKMYILIKYIVLLIFPHPLVFDYSYNHIPIIKWYDWRAGLSYIVYFGMITFILFHLFKREYIKKTASGNYNKDLIIFGILFYLISLSIVSNVFITIEATMAERFLYTPSLGFVILLGLFLTKITKMDLVNEKINLLDNKKLCILLTVLLIGYSYKTISRNKAWKDNFILYETDIKNLPNSARANYSLGSSYLDKAKMQNNSQEQQKMLNEAAKFLERAVDIFPEYHAAYINLSNAYNQLNRSGESIIRLKKMVSIDTTFANGFFQLGITYYNTGDYENAIFSFKKVLKLQSQNIQAKNHLANSYAHSKRHDEAIEILKNIISDFPGEADAKNNLANTYLDIGIEYGKSAEYEKAILYFNKALEINPVGADAYINSGIVYAQMKDFNKAIEHFEKASKIDPKAPDAFINLGIVYEQLGEKNKAEQYFQKAKSLQTLR